MTSYMSTGALTLQDTNISGALDYELHSYRDGVWEIRAIDHSKRKNSESIVAEFGTELQAMEAWEQIMLASSSDRGVLHFASATPCWDVKSFDPVTFKISTTMTRDEDEKNRLVEFYRDRAGFPVKVTETPIQHWTENPLFAAE